GSTPTARRDIAAPDRRSAQAEDEQRKAPGQSHPGFACPDGPIGGRYVSVFQFCSVMTYTNEYRLGRHAYHNHQEESRAFALSTVGIIILAFGYYILSTRFHIRAAQLIELSSYAVYGTVSVACLTWYFATLRRRRQANWPHPPLFISQAKDRKAVTAAYNQSSIVLGYNVHGEPWFWSDATRVMQSIVFGATGSGKTTLLKNIITQDVLRVVGPPNDLHRIPMLIFDGKGDKEFLFDLLPAIETAGRMHQLRVLDPSRPDISARYNPFFSERGLYQEHANLVFESFDLKEDFFHGHQATYLNDLVRVVAHTRKRFNIYDVLVLALDPQVLKEQIGIARSSLEAQVGVNHQRRLNFEMSVRNLQQSFEDRDRVPKIQGLLNELMTFL